MEAADGTLAWALPAARFVQFAALTLLFGGLLFPAYAKPGSAAPPGLRRALRAEAWIGLLAAGAVYALGVGGMAGSVGSSADLGLLWTTAITDPFGWAFLVRAALLLACALLLIPARPQAAATWMAGGALAALSLTGHAREGLGAAAWLHTGVDALHLVCAGLWIGALPWFATLTAPDADPQTALAATRRFSAVAGIAVAVLLLTGAIATVMLVGSPLKLLETTWGALLLAKIALAAVMIGFAAHNRWRITPHMAAGDPAGALSLRRNARIELGLALVVLALVGLLGTLPYERMTMPM